MDWKNALGWSDAQIKDLRFGAFALLREGKYEKAKLYFETLVLLDPTSAYDAETLGALYLQLGAKENALTWLSKALELSPTHEPTRLNKAKALLQLQRINEALVLLNELQKSPIESIAKDATALKLAYS